MRIVITFIWIALGAIMLWFFSLNLKYTTDVTIFTLTFHNVNLVTIIFITFFAGIIIGALILAAQVLKSKAQIASLKREHKKLQKEFDELKSISVSEIQEPIPPETKSEVGG